jgi:polyisoprenoid-binding protein YceI
MSTATQNDSATWTIDASHSAVEFAVKHMMITTVRGRFGQVEGGISPVEGGWKAVAKIDASSIDTRADQRDAHLRSADFLDVENHAEITFESQPANVDFSKPGDRFKLPGTLTIRGVSRPVELDVIYEGRGGDPWGGERISFTATTRIDRRDFGLTWNQALEAGGVLVANDVNITIEAQLVKQA